MVPSRVDLTWCVNYQIGPARTLDLVVDFVTYVFVPAYAITASGLLLPLAAPLLGGSIAVTGALYFADQRMKTDDNHFRGFPALWNAAAFYLFLLKPAARNFDADRVGNVDSDLSAISRHSPRSCRSFSSTQFDLDGGVGRNGDICDCAGFSGSRIDQHHSIRHRALYSGERPRHSTYLAALEFLSQLTGASGAAVQWLRA